MKKSLSLFFSILFLILFPFGVLANTVSNISVKNGQNTLALQNHNGALVTNSGELYTWGLETVGLLANGSNATGQYTAVPTATGVKNVSQVAISGMTGALITNNGELYMWGSNEFGQLGNDTPNLSNVPIKVNLSETVTQVAIGTQTSMALTSSGSVYTWGKDYYGSLGNGNASGGIMDYSSTPTKINAQNITQIADSVVTKFLLTDSGELYYFGTVNAQTFASPTNSGITNIAQIAGGEGCLIALTKDGQIYTWSNLYNNNIDNYTKVTLNNVLEVEAGYRDFGALTSDGSLYTWGSNSFGQLGLGTFDQTNVETPTKVNLNNVTQICLGDEISGAITSDGSVYSWGGNRYGQLGNGTTDEVNVPTLFISKNSSNTPSQPSQPDQSDGEIGIYRLYNEATMEHLYTPSQAEVENLTASGWTDEGIAWYSDPAGKGIPTYRLYSPITARHLYTTDATEVELLMDTGNWTMDFNGQPIFGATTSGTAVYRLYNGAIRTHLLTTDQNEYNVLPENGWAQEGIAFYAF